MKTFLSCFIVCLASMAFYGRAKADVNQDCDSIMLLMSELAEVYENASTPELRKKASQEMGSLDSKLKAKKAYLITSQFDTLTATKHDYRNTGIMLLAVEQPDIAFWYFYRGAELKEEYCLNMVLIKLIKKYQDPLQVLQLMEERFEIEPSYFYGPYVHNLALLFGQFYEEYKDLSSPELVEGFRNMAMAYANLYFKASNNERFEEEIFDLEEFIDYSDRDDLKSVNYAWHTPYDHNFIGKTLKSLLDKWR